MLRDAISALAQYEPWLFAIALKTAALLLVSISIGQLLRRASASLRHFLYSISLASLLVIPVAARWLPELGLPVLPPSLQPSSETAKVALPPTAHHIESSTAISSATTRTLVRQHASFPATVKHAFGQTKNEPEVTSSVSAITEHPLNWRGILVFVWIFGAAISLIRIAVLTTKLRGLIRRATPVDAITLSSRLRWLCRDLGIRREVLILASKEIDVPIAAGIFDPKIVLSPESASWSETRRNAVLCHELAHIKRLDALTQLVGQIAAAIYWFNPLIWFTMRFMRLERERACDDYVLARGTPASDYAHELLEIVSTLRRPQPAAALAMARPSQLEGRVLALLNPQIRHCTLARGPAVALIAGAICVALPLAAATLQERVPASTPPSTTSAAPVSKQVMPSPSADVVEADTLGEVRGAIEGGVDGGVEKGIPGGVQDGVRAGIGNGFGTGSSDIGVPVYPGATAWEHTDGRGTVSLVDGAHVRRLQASAYLSQDKPQSVLQFYREHLKNFGQVVECAAGTNSRVDVQLDDASLNDPSACRSSEFGAGGTEIKVTTNGDRRIAVAMPHDAGSEIALVSYEPTSGTNDNAWSQVHTPSPPFDCFDGKSVEHNNVVSNSDHNGYRTWTASWSGGECSIDAHSSGTVRFNADATEIESITPGGFFEVNERKGDTLRRLRVEPSSNGQLSYAYKVNGSQQEFDAAAHAWFSRFLLELERVSGFAADTRVPALLKKGGPQAVLDEISKLESDYVRQVYFTKLFENATLPGPLLVKALDQAREQISTDYSLAQVLLTIAQKYDLNDEAQRTAFLNGANKLHTDYEHSRVLIELLKRPNLSPKILRAALESAKTIGTDYEKGRILTTLAGLSTFDENEISIYLDLASSIGTDYEHSRSLLALMEHQKLSSAAVSQILKSASSIGTDYEKSRILLAVDGSSSFDEKQIATYLSLVDSIGTDYERSRDLIALMHDHKLVNDSLARIIAETQKIGTDYEKARVLTEVAQRYQLQGAVRDAYIKAADSIGTEYDRNRTLAAITKREMM